MMTVELLMEVVRHVLSGNQRGKCEGLSKLVITTKYSGIWFLIPVGTQIFGFFFFILVSLAMGAISLL